MVAVNTSQVNDTSLLKKNTQTNKSEQTEHSESAYAESAKEQANSAKDLISIFSSQGIQRMANTKGFMNTSFGQLMEQIEFITTATGNNKNNVIPSIVKNILPTDDINISKIENLSQTVPVQQGMAQDKSDMILNAATQLIGLAENNQVMGAMLIVQGGQRIIAGINDVQKGTSLLGNPFTAAAGAALIAKGLKEIADGIKNCKDGLKKIDESKDNLDNASKEDENLNDLQKETEKFIKDSEKILEEFLKKNKIKKANNQDQEIKDKKPTEQQQQNDRGQLLDLAS